MKKIIKFLYANKIFFPPKKKKYLILDRSQSTIFSNYLKKEDVNIMDTRYESINLLILLKTFLNFKFSFNDYIKEYIKNSGCEVIISFIDNKIFYYKLKRIFPQKTVILIQNGMRTEFFFKKLSKEKDLKLDYLLTFSNFYSKKYAKYVDGRCITIGSIKNNLIEKKILKKNNSIVFVSSRPSSKKKMNVFREISVKNSQYFSPEKKLLPLIAEFCKEKKMTLKVVARSKIDNQINFEKKFYDTILKDFNYKFLDSNGFNKIYQIADSSSVSVSIYSAFGLETLARGNKVSFFNTRDRATNFQSLNLFWSENQMQAKGHFWTNEINKMEVFRVLNFCLTSSDHEWKKSLKDVMPFLIFYDDQNKIFKNLLRKI